MRSSIVGFPERNLRNPRFTLCAPPPPFGNPSSLTMCSVYPIHYIRCSTETENCDEYESFRGRERWWKWYNSKYLTKN